MARTDLWESDTALEDSDIGAGFGLRELLGLRGGTGGLFLLILELTIVLYMLRNLSASPAWAVLLALLLQAIAGALVLVVAADPLPWPVTAFVVAAGPAATVLTVVTLDKDQAGHMVWTTFATSYVMAVLALRGRMAAAWLGVVAVVAVDAATGIRIGATDGAISAALVPLGTVTAISVFVVIMRPTQRLLRILREEATIRATAEATMAAADSERIRQLSRLDRVARPILERIADGAELSPAEREECRLLEAELRDGLRAPQLMTDELGGAARGARSRGVEVVLLDDGGFAGAPKWVRQRVIDAATRELDAANAGSVTVRVLPVGRRVLATVLANAPDHDQRTEIDTDGNVSVST
ncbi:hypothetical protein [Nocardia sp. BMG51109]|uniref:hypothetical protein n=1 Tax=Nocardia sp. BMG51109 TaxID=1056816 RepID=UPI0004B73BAF|nr:hypothetical protein [Nocardia sp. BMG51109]